MKNKRIEKTFKPYEWPELKRLRNQVKAGKIMSHVFDQAKLNAQRKK